MLAQGNFYLEKSHLYDLAVIWLVDHSLSSPQEARWLSRLKSSFRSCHGPWLVDIAMLIWDRQSVYKSPQGVQRINRQENIIMLCCMFFK